MRFEQNQERLIIYDCDSFSIAETLECGQCFRFLKKSPGEYEVIAHGRVITVAEYDNRTEIFPVYEGDFDIWREYFDLDRNYRIIKEVLCENDVVIRDAVEAAGGIRLLKQDPWECMISFIISQNNRIPMIKQVIHNICTKYGEEIQGKYSFPSAEVLARADIDGLMGCKTGFRAKYILDAANRVASGELSIEELKMLPTAEAKQKLMSVNGIGPKIADCVLLFSFGRYEVFPTDVWIKRVMQHFYFDSQDTAINEIHRLADENFGEYSGFAQQYLYVYARENKIKA